VWRPRDRERLWPHGLLGLTAAPTLCPGHRGGSYSAPFRCLPGRRLTFSGSAWLEADGGRALPLSASGGRLLGAPAVLVSSDGIGRWFADVNAVRGTDCRHDRAADALLGFVALLVSLRRTGFRLSPSRLTSGAAVSVFGGLWLVTSTLCATRTVAGLGLSRRASMLIKVARCRAITPRSAPRPRPRAPTAFRRRIPSAVGPFS
jgi:hypothetical protein